MRTKVFLRKLLRQNRLLLFSILAAFSVLLVCSKSSPMYPMNDWVDVQCFLTVGRELLHGKIPYVDLVEQKGPVLYLLYALIALLSPKSCFGIFLLEVISFSGFLYYSGKIAAIYLGKSRLIYLVQLALAVLTCTSRAFAHGGSVEEISLVFFAYGLYSVLRAVHAGQALTFREAVINGIFAGCAFWIKYTMFGFYFGLALFVLIWYLASVRDSGKLLRVIGQFLLGFAIVSGVVIAFFWVVGGITEMFTVYFYNNIFLYPSESELSKWAQLSETFLTLMNSSRAIPVLLCFGAGFYLLQLHKNAWDLLGILLCFAGSAVGTCWGKDYAYYALVWFPFTVFGLIGIAWLLQSPHVKELYCLLAEHVPCMAQITTVAALCVSIWCCFALSSNTYLMAYEKEELPQYQFAEIIKQKENATLLNFGFLDGGFYYAADVSPACPYFCTLNLNTAEMWYAQYDVINEKKTDFIVTRKRELSEYNVDASGYELVATASLVFEKYPFDYFLYKVIEE